MESSTTTTGLYDLVTAGNLAGTADQLVGVIFLIAIAVTIFGGAVAANSERLVRAVAGLAICFIGLAGLYYFLNSPFVAMMQILIYVGAVCITIAFAIMLAPPEKKKKQGPSNMFTGPLGLISSLLLVCSLAIMALKTTFVPNPKINDGSVKNLGIELLTSYSMVFELVSVVLLTAIIGALVIGHRGRN